MPNDTEASSPYTEILQQAAARLEALQKRSSPSIATQIARERVAVAEAAKLLEGFPCPKCHGSSRKLVCGWCGGTGDL